MCGITGFVGPGDRDILGKMIAAIAHRGPDGVGSYDDPDNRVFLGHLRLAILDIEGGVQPMWNAQGSIGVTYNGEIYNHLELRAELQALGYVFKTDHSDTEVLIHGYSAWGEDLPGRLNGMFAFCIYDRPRKRLFLARDRFGEKPLFFSHQGGFFAFASELSALAVHPRVSTRLDVSSVQKFLAYGYLPAPRTILEGCEKLPGGSSMVFDVAQGTVRTQRYWQFKIEADQSLHARPEGELVEELRALIIEAVRRRLVSDVPLGFFLSGGIDSSAVLAAAGKFLAPENLRAFTLGFREPSFDESEPATQVAAALGARHQIEWLDMAAARAEVLPILSRLDEPTGDGSILPTTLLARFTRRHVTVALSGDGADELFAGYDPFSALAPARLYKAFVPRPLHQLLREAVEHLPVSDRNMSLDFRLRRTLSGLSYPQAMWNPVWLAPVEPDMMKDLFNAPLTPEELYSEALDLWSAGGSPAFVDKTLEFYTNFYLQDGILTKVDRAAMMFALESRAIFLDNDLVDFCRRLPHEFKLRGGVRKYLLKKAAQGLVPDHVIGRKKKGFGMPTAKWLRSIPAEPPLGPVEGVRMDKVADAWTQHRAGEADNRLFLWSWLSLKTFNSPGSATEAGLAAQQQPPPTPAPEAKTLAAT